MSEIEMAADGSNAQQCIKIAGPAIGLHEASQAFIEPARHFIFRLKKGEEIFRCMGDDDMREFMSNDGAQPFRCAAGAETVRKIVQNAAHPDKNIIIFKGKSIFYFVVRFDFSSLFKAGGLRFCACLLSKQLLVAPQKLIDLSR